MYKRQVENGLKTSITGRAIESGAISVEAVDIRDYTIDKHRHVDDAPYGGGAGTVSYTHLMEGSYGPYEVPEGCYFMMGDNRNNSLDARFWDNKFVAKNKIVAKVLFCYYPFNRIGKVD